MSNCYIIRSMKMGEFNTVAKLIYESVHTLCCNEYTDEELEAWVPSNLYMPTFRKSLFRCYAIVALNDKGEIVGFMSTERDGYINRLYTRPDCIKKGVASALLKNTEDWAIKHKIYELTLESSKSAERFYVKNGFEKVGVVNSIKNGLEFTSAKMRKGLRENG